ncbi:hypothetical protein HBH70_207980 [Parastagonospora nodorum]|nr:hypothetical protein HBH53_064390 [Parastagonospora nodorum]KAH3974157.1 hypothetical protein HBH51_093880 [Parastagonospora nodorum]KAH3979000.1 hypothetical protein HBH52_101850 [Parastagonospora nodorum]KAH3999714.1 hypothetical protein HBI10_111640 [Parastagonospora nodorum]KAH4014586.1 hypothetical protein HBI13_167970 [Parastagonospora nodorum]
MASKSSSPGPNPTTKTPAPKQARSRKTTTQDVTVGRAGSAGGIVLEKEKEAKNKPTPTPKPAQDLPTDTPAKTPRRKPRKLNKDPTPTTPASTSKVVEPPTPTEIEALKSRVHGLEAKVEELYKSGNLDRPVRSPRRRGKGRKASSQAQVPTLSSTKAKVDDDEDDEVEDIGRGDADEGVDELVRLEGELETARQDLAAFRPRGKRVSKGADEDDDVEDIPRDDTASTSANGRHVTLSGSYRIPLPASVSVDDVKHIQSGVSAAQNVARSFLEQRRAAVASSPSSSKPRPAPRSVSSSMEVIHADEGEKKSWGEWIGGYSVAISRAVKNIEHEAAVESQGGGGGGGGKKKAAGKRPGVKTKISGEQVEGLMS